MSMDDVVLRQIPFFKKIWKNMYINGNDPVKRGKTDDTREKK